jgi:hypothetical protein
MKHKNLKPLTHEQMIEYSGERCTDFNAECACCASWDLYDRIQKHTYWAEKAHDEHDRNTAEVNNAILEALIKLQLRKHKELLAFINS